MKKVISILVSLLMIVTIAYPKPVLAATGLDVYIYAIIGLSSSSSSAFLSSHSWIVIKNNGSAVKIGDYNLGQGKSITLGARGNGGNYER